MPRVAAKYIIIPACKKDAFFTDDLMMKIGPRSLVVNALKLAISLTEVDKVTVVTDSHEVSDIARQYDCNLIFDQALSFKQNHHTILSMFEGSMDVDDVLMILSPYLTNVSRDDMLDVIDTFMDSNAVYGFSAQEQQSSNDLSQSASLDALIKNEQTKTLQHVEGYILYYPNALEKDRYVPLLAPAKARSVQSIDDYWSAERHYQARKIIFRIIGNKNVGMGHIYRCISFAKMFLGHDIQFICREEDKLAVEKVAEYHFPVLSLTSEQEGDYLITQRPDLIINDTLSTTAADMAMIKRSGAKVITLEDKGAGLNDADLVINEIFSSSTSTPDHLYTGHHYVVLRDEFFTQDRKDRTGKHCLISFGGSDPSNYTQLVLSEFDDVFADAGFDVTVIIGQGYAFKENLYKQIKTLQSQDNITVIEGTDQIAKLMASADFAFAGNGRTVFELAQMSLPAIILPQHERELTHDFAHHTEGLCLLGLTHDDDARQELRQIGKELLRSEEKRYKMSSALDEFDFNVSKQNVKKLIEPLLRRLEEDI